MISRKEFLALVLPPLEKGEHYCTFGIKTVNEKDVVRQKFVESIDDISTQADVLVQEEFNAFFAMAKYGDPQEGRTTNNALYLKSFYIDLDCGTNKPFADLGEGLIALKSF